MIETLYPRASALARLLEPPFCSYICRQTCDEKALEKLTPPETKVARSKPSYELLAFLASL